MRTWQRWLALGALLFSGMASDCQEMMIPGDGMTPGAGDIEPPPSGGPTPAIAKLGELLLDGIPKNIALDLPRNRAFVGVDKRIRRFDLQDRVWLPMTSPNGTFYGLDESDDLLGQINPLTGRINRILGYPESILFPPLNAGLVLGMDYNPDTGKLFVIDVFALGRAATLFDVDPQSGQRTQIGDTGLAGPDGPLSSVFSLARDPASGLLYTADVTDRLWRIDPNTAMAELVSGNNIGFANVQGLSFSPLDGKLYGLNPPLNGPVQVVTIDINTGVGALVTELPLGYTGGSLAFKPDGTLWSINLLGVTDVVTHTDYLYQIDYTTNPATIPVEFPTVEFTSSSPSFDVLFQGIDSLCFAPEGGGDQTVPTFQNVDAVAVDHDGGVMASAGSGVFGFDPDFQFFPSGINPGGLQSFMSIAVHPVNDVAYVRDGISGEVHEFVPVQIGVTNTIQYRPAAGAYFHPQQPDSGIDPMTNRLFLVGDFQLHRVDLGTGFSEEIDDGANDDPVGVIVDPVRRRLHVNMQLGGPGGCSSIRTYQLDTMQMLGEICGSSFQIFNMAFDPVRNRIAANCRITAPSFDINVRFFDMDTFTEESFSPLLLQTASDNTNPSSAFLAIDPDRNQLVVARPDTPPRIEFYLLPN